MMFHVTIYHNADGQFTSFRSECPRPRNTPHWRPNIAPLMATVLPTDGQIPPR